MKLSPQKVAFGVVSVCVSAGLVAWLLFRADLARMRELLVDVQWPWLALATLAVCLLPICNTIRWQGVLRVHPEHRIPFAIALRAVLIALVLNSFLPSKSGDMAKAFYLKNHGGLSRGLGTVILERLSDLAILGSLGILGYLLTGTLWGLWGGATILVGVISLFSCIVLVPSTLFPEKFQEKIGNFRDVFHLWRRAPISILITVSGSISTWLLAGSVVCCLLRALGQTLSWGYAISIYPLAVLAGLLPTTVAGAGTRDAAFIHLLEMHIPTEEATLVGLGYTFFVYWLLSLLGLPAVALEIRRFFSKQ